MTYRKIYFGLQFLGRIHNNKEGMAGGVWIRKSADYFSVEPRKQRTRGSRIKLESFKACPQQCTSKNSHNFPRAPQTWNQGFKYINIWNMLLSKPQQMFTSF